MTNPSVPDNDTGPVGVSYSRLGPPPATVGQVRPTGDTPRLEPFHYEIAAEATWELVHLARPVGRPARKYHRR